MGRIRALTQRFFAWYERHYALNVGVAAGLFLLQLVHLYWLSADVVARRLSGASLWEVDGWLAYLVLLVDYVEIPSLFGVSLIYVNELRKRPNWRSVLFLLLLNSQWLHILWITDEFVVGELARGGGGSGLPGWLAWVAIGIDYLELPVILDILGKFAAALRDRQVGKFLAEKFAD